MPEQSRLESPIAENFRRRLKNLPPKSGQHVNCRAMEKKNEGCFS